jgi:CheY-like chemotaxis protein
MVQLTVCDSGCGMSEATLARAVEPFFTTKGREGSGLGLSTVLGTMRSLGGEMTLRSSEGGGTEVTLWFPAVDGAAERPKAEASASPRPTGGTRILVVDDESAVRTAVQRNLTLRGFDVSTAIDGQDALELLERTGMAVDAVVSDINMPRVNGITLAQRLRERGATFPIVLMTGYAGPELERGGLPHGTALLGKPFDFGELARLLGRLL